MTTDTMKRERDRFVAFAFAAADILIEMDHHGVVLFADGAISGLLGVSPQALVGQAITDLVIPTDAPVIGNLLTVISKKLRLENIPLSFHTHVPDAPLPMTASAFYYSGMEDHVFLSVTSRRLNTTSEDLRQKDATTGTLNKEAFADIANKRILQAQSEGTELELTLLDLPQLQAVLDGLSTTRARALLLEIGEYLNASSHGGDTATNLGEGHSFSLLHGVGLKSSEVIANVRSIVSRLAPKAPIMDVTAQTIRTKTNGLSQQDSANALLYTLNRFAESHGEDFTIESISNGYDEMLTKTVEQIESFRSILNEEMFDIAYQPIVDIKTGVIHHYECLVRLKEAAPKDFSNPFHFITFGESSGLINEFDLLMADKTLHMLQGEVKKGKKPLVSVNLSGRSLSSSLFMDSFERMMEAQPQVRKQLILEITESSIITDLKLANNFVQKLRKEGNLVCLDDFGSGESSFDYLRSLQVDFIKIDGSYVKESMQSQHGRDMLRAMAGLCRALNIVTIGEMVEDEKCAHFLWESGIKFGQGYYFGKPTTELATLENFKKILPNYPEIVRAKRFEVSNRPWWARRDQ